MDFGGTIMDDFSNALFRKLSFATLHSHGIIFKSGVVWRISGNCRHYRRACHPPDGVFVAAFFR